MGQSDLRCSGFRGGGGGEKRETNGTASLAYFSREDALSDSRVEGLPGQKQAFMISSIFLRGLPNMTAVGQRGIIGANSYLN